VSIRQNTGAAATPIFMCSAHNRSDLCDKNRAVAKKRAPVFLLSAMALGSLVLTSTIGRTQNLLSNGSLTTTVAANSVQAIGATTTFIANWNVTVSTNSGANNYSVNGNQTAQDFIPNPPASAPSTFSVMLDSTTSGANNGHNGTISYKNTVSLLANARYDLSFYLNSETAQSGDPVGSSATSTLNLNGTGATGLGLTITSVTMVNAGSATGTHTATGFSNTVSGTTVNLTAPTIQSGSTSATQPWVKVDIIFSTTNAPTLPAGSILFTDLGSSAANNSSVGDFSLTRVVPEMCDWRITGGFCVLCVALGSVAKRRRTSHLEPAKQ
jgi:hypothetical protein